MVKDWIKYIQDEIDKSKNYEYKRAFMEYQDYLKKCLLENPQNKLLVN